MPEAHHAVHDSLVAATAETATLTGHHTWIDVENKGTGVDDAIYCRWSRGTVALVDATVGGDDCYHVGPGRTKRFEVNDADVSFSLISAGTPAYGVEGWAE